MLIAAALTLFAVGLWAAQYRGRAVWMIPLAFVSAMVLGGPFGTVTNTGTINVSAGTLNLAGAFTSASL